MDEVSITSLPPSLSDPADASCFDDMWVGGLISTPSLSLSLSIYPSLPLPLSPRYNYHARPLTFLEKSARLSLPSSLSLSLIDLGSLAQSGESFFSTQAGGRPSPSIAGTDERTGHPCITDNWPAGGGAERDGALRTPRTVRATTDERHKEGKYVKKYGQGLPA